MKKLFAVILVVVLVAGGLGGFAYAQIDHQSMKGQKLIGTTANGKSSIGPTDAHALGLISITNPDCVGEITIDRIALIRGDGEVVYDGPLVELVRDMPSGEVIEEIPITEPMKPHSIISIATNSFMKDPDAADPDRWLTIVEAWELPYAQYTLEVSWTAEKKCLSPMGQIINTVLLEKPDGTTTNPRTYAPMVEVKQRLKN